MAKRIIPERWIRPFILVAATIGLVEGLTWIILSIIGISTYNGSNIDISEIGPTDYNKLIYKYFLYNRDHWLVYSHNETTINSNGWSVGSTTIKDYISITAPVFAGFLWTYLIFNLAWMAASGLLIYFVVKKLQRSFNARYVFAAWAVVAAAIFLTDVILTLMLDSDRGSRSNFMSVSKENADAIKATLHVYGVMKHLAVKFYFFLILNLSLAVVFCIITVDEFKNSRRNDKGAGPEENPLRQT